MNSFLHVDFPYLGPPLHKKPCMKNLIQMGDDDSNRLHKRTKAFLDDSEDIQLPTNKKITERRISLTPLQQNKTIAEGCFSSDILQQQLTKTNITRILTWLEPYVNHWRDIGFNLGFTVDHLDRMNNYHLLESSYLKLVNLLMTWVDFNGQEGISKPNLINLKSAFNNLPIDKDFVTQLIQDIRHNISCVEQLTQS